MGINFHGGGTGRLNEQSTSEKKFAAFSLESSSCSYSGNLNIKTLSDRIVMHFHLFLSLVFLCIVKLMVKMTIIIVVFI